MLVLVARLVLPLELRIDAEGLATVGLLGLGLGLRVGVRVGVGVRIGVRIRVRVRVSG